MTVSSSHEHKWVIFSAVGAGVFLSTVDGSIVNVALPTLARHFGSALDQVQWVVLGYLLVITSLAPGIGRLADIVGRKRIYAAGLAVFTFGSLLCGVAPGIGWLVAFRFIQGVGGAVITSLAAALVTEAFPPTERGKVLGLVGSLVSIGIVIGPTIGGLILDSLSWRWIFYVNLPVGIGGIWLVIRRVPADRPDGDQRFDVPGAVALFVALAALLVGLTLEQGRGLRDGTVLGLLALSAVSLVLFVVIERRSSDPLLDLALLKAPFLAVNLVTGLVVFVCLAGSNILAPFYLQGILGLSLRTVGFLLAVVPLAMGVVAPFSGAAADSVGPRWLTFGGLVILSGGLFGARGIGLLTTPESYALMFLPVGIAFGLFQSPNVSMIMAAAPPGRLGVVSGLSSLTRTLGAAVGVATMGALWASRVTARAGALPKAGPSSAPPDIQVAALRDSYLVLAILVALAAFLAGRAAVSARRRR